MLSKNHWPSSQRVCHHCRSKFSALAGLVITAFGPSNTYLLLHVLYGPKYSSTEAPIALAAYCPYILLLATNGILECFVQV